MIPTDSKCENIIDKYTDIEIDSLINIIYYSIRFEYHSFGFGSV